MKILIRFNSLDNSDQSASYWHIINVNINLAAINVKLNQ